MPNFEEPILQPAYRADEVLSAVARATEQQALESLLTRLKHLSENSAGHLCDPSLSDQQSIPEEAVEAREGAVFESYTLEFIVLFFFGIAAGFAICALYNWVSL
jgi:hypothetical protein